MKEVIWVCSSTQIFFHDLFTMAMDKNALVCLLASYIGNSKKRSEILET